ncbi:MAG TPA: alpha/beta hydrolase-fold protein [Edaphobacter sp.]|nr:alpha/beta hydrolase-fold protein [Edaphobacter sp.]
MNILPRPAFLRMVALLAFFTPLSLVAQAPARLRSTIVRPDRSVTFSYKSATASTVALALDGVAKPIPMEKDVAGIWRVTTEPLAPEIYSYHFEVDGDRQLDPLNPRTTINLLSIANVITVRGDTPQPWEDTNVPHGTLHRHIYTTGSVVGLPEDQSGYFVYTPPGYDEKSKKPYPVLYLLHGWSDSDSGWTDVGRANLIFDNLLAAGRIKPMVVVMPLGYGDLAFLRGHNVWDDPAAIDRNTDLFSKALLSEVLPRVESEYRVSRDRNDRAIAGLSMGGLESLEIGLTHTGQFAWIGGFSSAVDHLDYAGNFAALDGKAANLRLLWIACGTEDSLIEPNRRLVAFLKTKEMPVAAIETPGLHSWLVWRDNLIHFAPLLFQQR